MTREYWKGLSKNDKEFYLAYRKLNDLERKAIRDIVKILSDLERARRPAVGDGAEG